MKLIIQIPCLNEEEALPGTLSELPRKLEPFDAVEWLVVDDGSTDRTVEVARRCGVDHVVRLKNNKGLAAAFQAGLDASLKLGADVIVNTDADNEHRADEIPGLVAPIVEGGADMVVGCRDIGAVEHFSRLKRLTQRLGSWVVRKASQTKVPDTTSGFRAYNREAALQVHVVNSFTYTLESLIQAGTMLVAIDHVPVKVNPPQRPSRLFPSARTYVRRNALAIFRAYAMYQPLRVFTVAAVILAIAALGAWMPLLIDWWIHGNPGGHLQSLILGAVLAIAAVQMLALGIVGDILAGQRTLTQRMYERIHRVELQTGVAPSHYEPAERPDGSGNGGPATIPGDGTRPAPVAREREREESPG